MKDDVISRNGVSAWLDNMGYPRLADVIMDEKRFPSAQPEKRTDKSAETHACDCISRQAVIDAYGDWYVEEGTEEGFIGTVKQLLEGFPSAQPEQRWIPCSERLPEEDTEVLISYRYKEGEGDTDHVNIDITSYGTVCFGGREIHTLKEWRQPFDYFHANYEVIAWMPLPKPYKEDDHDHT